MNKLAGLLCLGLCAVLHPPASRAAGIRVFNCDQPVQSTKRGVCANELTDADFRLLAPGVLWFYSYMGPGEVKWAVDLLHKEFNNRPVWVTEFAPWKTGGPEEARKNLMQATDFLERTPYVRGYA